MHSLLPEECPTRGWERKEIKALTALLWWKAVGSTLLPLASHHRGVGVATAPSGSGGLSAAGMLLLPPQLFLHGASPLHVLLKLSPPLCFSALHWPLCCCCKHIQVPGFGSRITESIQLEELIRSNPRLNAEGLIFGTLYPAYYSYKAVKSKDIKEYVKWMMYWIIFALFTTAETFTDIFLCWFPFYYELKIAFVAWLLSPYTKGSSLLYRKFVHPTLSSKEKEIDDCLVQAKDRSYDALVHFGKRGLNVAATAAVMAASKGQGALSERLRSFSMQDLSSIRGDSSSAVPGPVPVPLRAGGRQSQPKAARGASEGSGSSVCSCCSVCRLLTGVDNKYQKPAEASCEVEGSVFSDDEENRSLDPAPMSKRLKKKDPPLEAPPRTLRPRFRKSTSSSAADTV